MKIAFHVTQFTFRGSEVALFDYAFYNRQILCNLSVIVCPKIQKSEPDLNVVEKFRKEFDIIYYSNMEELDAICTREKIDAVYTIKYGTNDGFVLKNTPTWVHCVFTTNEPHGTVYAGVSDSVSSKNNKNIKYPVVNHVVYLPDIQSNYRNDLGIPENAIVLGRHGGNDTFNIPFVKDAIIKVLNEREDIWFLFCVKPYIFDDFIHPRVLYINSFADNRIKRKFINTCDAMIHACTLGESFGLSVLEFSYCGKPVVTFNGGLWHKQHLANLGDKAITYNNEEELVTVLRNITKFNCIDASFRINDFSAPKIMKQFENVFIKATTL